MKEVESLELKISWFLRIGVIIAGALMLVGIILNFKLNGNPFYIFQDYDEIPFRNALYIHLRHQHWGHLFSYAGLISLISLPLIRVLLTAILYLKQKEFLMAGLASFVFFCLVVSFSLGIEL
jgi:uncharacterized membrane protein